jgi:hypothetical protein
MDANGRQGRKMAREPQRSGRGKRGMQKKACFVHETCSTHERRREYEALVRPFQQRRSNNGRKKKRRISPLSPWRRIPVVHEATLSISRRYKVWAGQVVSLPSPIVYQGPSLKRAYLIPAQPCQGWSLEVGGWRLEQWSWAGTSVHIPHPLHAALLWLHGKVPIDVVMHVEHAGGQGSGWWRRQGRKAGK